MRELRRNRQKQVIAGVAAGLADYFEVDPVIIRIGFVLLALANGIGILLYVAGWFVMPVRDQDREIPPAQPAAEAAQAAAAASAGAREVVDGVGETVRQAAAEMKVAGEEVRAAGSRMAEEVRGTAAELKGSSRTGIVAGAALIVLGVLLLADRVPWFDWPDWARFESLWPLILVLIGGAIIFGALRAASANVEGGRDE